MPNLKPILLVEDNLNDIELVLRALKKNNLANEVVTARHGGEALDYLFRRGEHAGRVGDDPIFILLDLKMPKVDGLQVLEELKNDETLGLIPVVMLTSSSEETDLLKSYRLGVNAYVIKPVDFTQFVDVIRQIGVFWAVINIPPPASALSKHRFITYTHSCILSILSSKKTRNGRKAFASATPNFSRLFRASRLPITSGSVVPTAAFRPTRFAGCSPARYLSIATLPISSSIAT